MTATRTPQQACVPTARQAARRALAAVSALLLGVATPALLLAAEPAVRKFAEPTPAQSAPAPVSSLAQVAFSLALVLAAVFAAAWVLKRMRGIGNTRDDSAITVVAERAVGPRERVVLLQVGTDRVLVGVANGSVRALHTSSAGTAPVPGQPT
jgi:flagellar protein FliO/FliZ